MMVGKYLFKHWFSWLNTGFEVNKLNDLAVVYQQHHEIKWAFIHLYFWKSNEKQDRLMQSQSNVTNGNYGNYGNYAYYGNYGNYGNFGNYVNIQFLTIRRVRDN